MIIRPATPADPFVDIMKTSIRDICAVAYGAEATKAWVSDDNPAFHFRIPQFAFVAVDDGGANDKDSGEVIAVGGWSLTDKVDLHPIGDRKIDKPTHARINAMYLKPGFEGRGLGGKMLAHLEQDIQAKSKLRDVYLWATTNAVPFYEAQGYAPGVDAFPEVAAGYPVQIRYMWKRLG